MLIYTIIVTMLRYIIIVIIIIIILLIMINVSNHALITRVPAAHMARFRV